MKTVLSPYDDIGRYGGEEFLLVLTECDASGAMTLAERLRSTIATKALTLAEGMTPLTVSLGVATSSLAQETEALISAADAALYRAKNNGRNRVELATVADVMAESALKGSMA